MSTQLDRLDQVAASLRSHSTTAKQHFYCLSGGEQIYAALAANRTDLLKEIGYTIPAALARLGPDWTAELIQRHEYR